jgi:hypothetical protein
LKLWYVGRPSLQKLRTSLVSLKFRTPGLAILYVSTGGTEVAAATLKVHSKSASPFSSCLPPPIAYKREEKAQGAAEQQSSLLQYDAQVVAPIVKWYVTI